MVLDNDTRGWVMAVVSGIGACGNMHEMLVPLLIDLQRVLLEVKILRQAFEEF